MTRQEAVNAIIRMMTAYPTFKCPETSLMTLAEVLLSFPREVATAACSPIHGVPKVCKEFPPNAGQITDWCEREGAWLARMALHAAPSLPPPPDLDRSERPTLAEAIARAAKIMGRKVTPDGNIGKSAETIAAELEAKVKQIEWIDRANTRFIEVAYESAGIKFSTALAATLKEQESKYGPNSDPAGAARRDDPGDGC
jgi:hypothetical protein